MPDPINSIVNLGELSKPATVLIEKISDAIGGVFKPYQIRRMAEAEAYAEKVKAVLEIEIIELQNRALQRFLIEETNKQNNIENIIRKSLSSLDQNATPENIEKDWIINFFDKSKLISDEDMQELWAKILAGEGNAPGSFSKRTVNLAASLDKGDATLFSTLSNFLWLIGDSIPLVYEVNDEIYTKNGINFSVLKHLDSIGLISFEGVFGYKRMGFGKIEKVFYQGNKYIVEFSKDKDNEIEIGRVLLTGAGSQLIKICKPQKIEGLADYILQKWKSQGINEHNLTQVTEMG